MTFIEFCQRIYECIPEQIMVMIYIIAFFAVWHSFYKSVKHN